MKLDLALFGIKKDLLKSIVKQKLFDQFIQTWFSQILQGLNYMYHLKMNSSSNHIF